MGKNEIVTVNQHLNFKQVSLISPTDTHYIHLAAEIDSPAIPLFLTTSRKKKAVIAESKELCARLQAMEGVANTVVFKAKIIPPGKGRYLQKRPEVHVAKFDVVILITAKDSSAITAIQDTQVYKELKLVLEKNASYTQETIAKNARRIGPVDHSTSGTFLFNYFVADNLDRMLGIWEYTAGWFQQETGLDNSELMLPLDPSQSPYAVVNHCRWNSLLDILPSIVFKRSFRKYVLENFEANNVAAIPILYTLA